MIGRMMASAIALTGVAYAQETTPPTTAPAPPTEATGAPTTASADRDRVSYDAVFFAQFNPQTALDMVRQVPGFSLDGGEDRRGFSGAVGNLLIDALRPSTKSQSLEGILQRIPANQVVRIEVLRGAAVAGDASGQSVLLNIVRTPTAGGGVYEAGFEVTSRDVLAPRGELSYSGRSGQVEYGAGLSIFSQYRDLPGWRRIYQPTDTLIEVVDTPSPRDFREGALTGNLAFPLAGGRLTATGQLSYWAFHSDNGFFTSDPGGTPLRNQFTIFDEDETGLEVGVNYDRDLGPWSLALIGLINRSQYQSEEPSLTENFVNATTVAEIQQVEQEAGESILRGTLSRNLTPQHRIEVGGEGAFNSLDQTLVFEVNGAPEDIPNSNILVEEERAELFGSYTWRPSEAWSFETRLAWETSTLTFAGDTDQVVELSFWKPSVQLARTFAGGNQLRFRVYRDVGQLDFGDFSSTAAIVDDLIAGGNPDLVPQTDWRTELGADLRFPGGRALSLTLTHHQISDVADLVKLTDTRGTADPADDRFFDAPGNIGDAEAWSLDANFSSPVPLVPGGRVTVEGYLWDTEVTDPVTGQTRIVSERPESEISISFRQDITNWRFAWGVEVFKQGEFQIYRFNEIDTNEEGPWIDVFVETTALPNNMKLRLWAANAFDGTVNRDRRFFGVPGDGNALNDDRNSPNFRRDLRERRFASAPWWIVELSGTF